MCDNLVSVSLVKRKEETADLDVIEVASTADSISLSSNNNRRKVKHPMSRRTLRQRKIHSLKRQIQIKEKMLEVLHKVAYYTVYTYSSYYIHTVVPKPERYLP